MIKDLVHADPLPAETQNGQLTAVPAAIHAMAAVIFSSTGDDVSPEDARRIAAQALHALGQSELPAKATDAGDTVIYEALGHPSDWCPDGSPAADAFRAIVRALASPNDEGKAE